MATRDLSGTPETGAEQRDPKSGQETPSNSPNVSDFDSKTCASDLNVEELYLSDSKTEETTLMWILKPTKIGYSRISLNSSSRGDYYFEAKLSRNYYVNF